MSHKRARMHMSCLHLPWCFLPSILGRKVFSSFSGCTSCCCFISKPNARELLQGWDIGPEQTCPAGTSLRACCPRSSRKDLRTFSGCMRCCLISKYEAGELLQGWDSVFVAGHSYGGPLTIRIAAEHPKRIAGILCLGSSFVPSSSRSADWLRLGDSVPTLQASCQTEHVHFDNHETTVNSRIATICPEASNIEHLPHACCLQISQSANHSRR